jgi:cytidylate kinase
MRRRIRIAIDGPAGAGKSTVAKCVATRLGYGLLDTGAMFRSLALKALRDAIDLSSESQLSELASSLSFRFQIEDGVNRVWVNEEDLTSAIREERISEASSQISGLPAVRRALLTKQRELLSESGVVLEGRDTGTVVCPEAELKIFLDADPKERAKRRMAELDSGARLEQVEADMRLRDRKDSSRQVAPLVAAEDATRVDTTHLSLEEVCERIIGLAESRLRV